jgi:hypothetical protein
VCEVTSFDGETWNLSELGCTGKLYFGGRKPQVPEPLLTLPNL